MRKKKASTKKPIKEYLLALGFVALILAIPLTIVKTQDTNRQSQAASVQPVGQTGGWNLIFSDEFEGTSLDTTKWVPCFPWGDANGCQSSTTPKMTYRPDNVIVGNGIVRLQARQGSFIGTDGKTYPYSSGMISTAGYDGPSSYKYMNKYGYMEARIKVPKGKGIWPAFWTLPPEGNWPPEIDIMEVLTSDTNSTYKQHMHFHYCDNYVPTVDCPSGHNLDSGGTWTSPVDLAADYHVYAVDWSPTAIRWYVDGVERRTAFTDTSKIPAELMYSIFNLQVGGSWPGDPDSTTPFPSYMDIDYIRIWEKCTTDCEPTPTAEAPTATPAPLPTATPVPTAAPVVNLLQNSSFEDTLSPWAGKVISPAIATINTTTSTRVSGKYSAYINVKRASSNAWYVQLYQGDLPIIAGKTYTVTFWARASKKLQLQNVIQQHGGTWKEYSNKSFSLSTSWKKFTYTFTAPVSTTGYFTFNAAKSTGIIWVDSVSMTSN